VILCVLVAIDNHWLPKINAKIDKKNNKIELKAPSEFFKSYIESRYLSDIKEIAKTIGFQLHSIEG
jgi:chromosomal replication initiation ATPase DnaA